MDGFIDKQNNLDNNSNNKNSEFNELKLIKKHFIRYNIYKKQECFIKRFA